nr:MAG TPA: hypothetical protein [Caudoviricetes sp.]
MFTKNPLRIAFGIVFALWFVGCIIVVSPFSWAMAALWLSPPHRFWHRLRAVVRWLHHRGLALLLGDGRTLVQPFVPHAHASMASSGMAGCPQFMILSHPTLAVGF